jgi:hypothetical protein
VKDLAGQQTAHATVLVKQYVGDYSAKAQEYIGRSRSASPELSKAPAAIKAEPSSPQSNVQQTDFPEAPRDEPISEPPAPEIKSELIPAS